VFVAEGTAADIAVIITRYADTQTVFLVAANVLLLVLGCLIETLPAMLIALPILLPAAQALQVDLVHFGIVVIFNLLVGIMTPPMGIGLYILMAIGKLEFGELVRASIPFIIALLVALVLLTVFPQISLFLPDLLMPRVAGR
jgi:TRAP-type C4-dicarboxylate transport system permease large subunit